MISRLCMGRQERAALTADGTSADGDLDKSSLSAGEMRICITLLSIRAAYFLYIVHILYIYDSILALTLTFDYYYSFVTQILVALTYVSPTLNWTFIYLAQPNFRKWIVEKTCCWMTCRPWASNASGSTAVMSDGNAASTSL